MKSSKPDDVVIMGIYRKTRRRIKTNASKKDVTMKDYVEQLVPLEESGD